MTTLEQVLTAVGTSGPLLSIQPGGNHGDELIYRGFEKVLVGTAVEHVPFETGRNRHDAPPELPSANVFGYLDYCRTHATYLRHRFRTDPGAVYIHGGGNFNDIWQDGVICYRTAARHFDCPIVVGPQSCQFETTDPRTLFEDVENEVHFFCRETYSHDLVTEATRDLAHVTTYLADDTALSLTSEDLPTTQRGTDYTLVAMRTDAESASPLLREDIAAPIKVSDVSTAADSFEAFVAAVARAESVYTDRLHVAILATLLDKPVTWYEVAYHKSRGVYEYSLSDSENVTFVYRDGEDDS